MLKKDIETFQSAIKLKDEKNKDLEKDIKEKAIILEKKENQLLVESLKSTTLAQTLAAKELLLKADENNTQFKFFCPKLSYNEEIVYKQLTREIEEFRAWIKSETEKQKSTREIILSEIKQAITKVYPKLDVTMF
jgi:hypothetical protein